MTPTLTTLLLSDFAQVRDQLLFVSSGGISRVVHPSFPARVRISLAMVVHLPAGTVAKSHSVTVKLKYPDDAALIGTIEVAIKVHQRPAGAHPGEGINVPQVLDLSPVVFPRPGEVDVQVFIDGTPAGDLTFWMLQTPPKGRN